MKGVKKRVEKEKERIVRERGWFIPSIHSKYIRKRGEVNES
jgi:hypothetical protein